jgi:hypothetical protein
MRDYQSFVGQHEAPCTLSLPPLWLKDTKGFRWGCPPVGVPFFLGSQPLSFPRVAMRTVVLRGSRGFPRPTLRSGGFLPSAPKRGRPRSLPINPTRRGKETGVLSRD